MPFLFYIQSNAYSIGHGFIQLKIKNLPALHAVSQEASGLRVSVHCYLFTAHYFLLSIHPIIQPSNIPSFRLSFTIQHSTFKIIFLYLTTHNFLFLAIILQVNYA